MLNPNNEDSLCGYACMEVSGIESMVEGVDAPCVGTLNGANTNPEKTNPNSNLDIYD